MIKYSYEEGFIKSQGIRDVNDSRDSEVVLPKTAIGVFSVKLFDSIIERFNCKRIGYFGGATFHRPVYVMKYNEKEFYKKTGIYEKILILFTSYLSDDLALCGMRTETRRTCRPERPRR